MKIFLALFLMTHIAQAQTTQLGKSLLLNEKGVPRFTMEHIAEQLGSTSKHVITFRDEDGAVLSEETVTMIEDGQVGTYNWTRQQDELRFTMSRQGKKWKLALNKEEETLRIPSNNVRVLVPPIIAAGLVQEWKKDESLKTFRFQLLAPDRLETFSFIFTRTSEDAGTVTWTLKPENFFVRMVAGEIGFVFNKDKTLNQIRNFMPPIKFRNTEGRLENQKSSLQFQ